MGIKVPMKKRPKDSREWDPIHYQTNEKDFTTGDEKKDAVVQTIVSYMQENDPNGYIRQITECIITGGLIVHAEGNEETQLFIYNTLRKCQQ
jgi:hypothetical protein